MEEIFTYREVILSYLGFNLNFLLSKTLYLSPIKQVLYICFNSQREGLVQFSSVQSLSRVRLFATP